MKLWLAFVSFTNKVKLTFSVFGGVSIFFFLIETTKPKMVRRGQITETELIRNLYGINSSRKIKKNFSETCGFKGN